MESNNFTISSNTGNLTFAKTLIMMTPFYDVYSDSAKYIVIIVSLIVCITSHVLYTTVFHLILTRKKLQTRANFVTSMLFVSGAILGFVAIPMIIAELLSTKLQRTESYHAARSYLVILYVAANTGSVVMISLITAIQLRIQRPVKKKYIAYGMTIVAALSLSFPCVLACTALYLGSKPLGLLTASATALAFIILCASYEFVRHEVKKSKKRLHFTGSQIHSINYDKKVKKTIDRILTSFVFTNICLFAKSLVTTYQSFDEEFGIKYGRELMHFDTVTYLVMILGIVINPLIYFYTQSDLIKEVKTLWVYQFVFSKH